ncbi:probable pre-mRNA-splicing factor rse1 at N-terminal half [Coccomyxa sp. Obi]|nr:probable pre-mRNA-splicing factor rse1 at N-terminal half [Coccomyxa sp. Obi]
MTYFLAKTVVEQDNILNTTSGSFLEPDKETVLFGRPSSIEVFRETELGVLTSVHKQPLFDKLLALARIAAQPCTLDEQCSRDLDLPILLLESQRLAVLRYDAGLHRFANMISVDLQAAGLPRYLHGSILEVHERSRDVALATREGDIAVFRGAGDLLCSFLAPLTHQFPMSHLACEPPQYHDPRIVKDICFVAVEPDACGLLVVLVELERDDHTFERQLHWLQVKSDCLAHLKRMDLDNGSNGHSGYSQLLPAPWPRGVLLLSSLRLMHIVFDASILAATANVTAELHDHIKPHFEHMYSHSLRAFKEVDLNVVACWQSTNYSGGVMLLCLDTCKLLVDVERSHSEEEEILLATPRVIGKPAGKVDVTNRNCRPIFLSSGAFLLRTAASTVELHAPCELTAGEQREMYGVSQRLGHPATIVDATMCDLTGLSQPQVYAVSTGGLRGSDACGMRVMHAGLVVETLFKSPANYQGVTGLWSIPFAPADASSALIIISFASGSRAMTAGSTLSDVTDLIDLECNSQTLAAGSIGNLLAVQVTSEGVFLCSLHSLWPGTASRSYPHKSMLPEDMRPRKRSSPSDEDVHLDFTSSEESVSPRLAHADGARSSADSAAEPTEAFSSLHLEALPEGRDRGMVWVPPGGATTSCACIREGIVVLACPQLKSLTALALIHSADVESPSSSGKRKRCAPSLHMVEAAQIGMPAEVSCIDAMDAPKGLGCPGGLMFAVGTYERAVELLLLDRHHSSTNGTCWHFQRLCRLQHAALSPVLHSSGMPPNLTDLPESVLLLEGAPQQSQMQVLVGWRSGLVMQIDVRPAHAQETDVAIDEAAGRMSACLRLLPQVQSATQSSTAPDVSECAWEMKIVCVRRFTALPTRLIPLPTGMQAHALAVGERVSLLKFSPCSGKIQLDMLALADISHAVPLLDVSESGGKSGGPKRCRLLVADGDGSLRLLELEAGSTRRTREFSLAGMPKCIAVHQPHQPSATMVVLVNSWNDTNASSDSHEDHPHPPRSSLVLVDAASGAVKSVFQLPADQLATCITSLGTSFSASKQDLQARAYFAVGAMVSVITDAQLFGPNPLIRSCVTVFAADPGGIHPIAKVSLPDPVTAVCHFRDRQILAAVGQRVACFECAEDLCTSRMETIAWTPTREEIRSLSVSEQGIIAAAGETQSVTLYTCTAEDGFEVLCADPHSRNAVSCLVGPSRPEGLQSAVCLDAHGGVYSLQYEPSERCLERNMHMDMHFHCRGTGGRILPGSLRCDGAASPAGTMGPWVVCTEEGSVMQLSPVAAEDYAVLAAVEAAMARTTLTAPVSGGSHSAFRSAVEGSAGGSRALAQSLAGGSMRAVDADFIVQLDELPEAEVQHVLDSVNDHDLPCIQAAGHGGLMSKGPFLVRARSLPYVMDLLDRVLSTY